MRHVPALLLMVLLSSCGEQGLDRRDAMAVYHRAMEAVHDGEWSVLRGLLTKDARMEMERDLQRLKRRLGHESDGRRERVLARERMGAEAEAAVQRVVQGGPGEALRFFVKLMPRDRRPPTRGMEITPTRRSVLYALSDETVRQVRLVLVGEEWRIADLQL